MHYGFRQEVDRRASGPIGDILDMQNLPEIINDGANFTIWKEIDPESQMPCGFNQEIILRITDADVDVTKMDETFIAATITTTLRFTDLLYHSTGGDVCAELQKGIYLFVGLKNASDVLRDYTVFHRGLTVGNTL